jgi:cytochrome c oxidase assembly protein Cox11
MAVSVKYQQSFCMRGGNDRIRRIMEVDASVLLHSWSLAAAAMEVGRMIDVRSATATARALPVPMAASTDPVEVQPSTTSTTHFHLAQGDRTTVYLRTITWSMPYHTLLYCRYVDFCYCFTGHISNTTALRHGNLPPRQFGPST